MKTLFPVASTAILMLSLVTAPAQFGPSGHGGPSGPHFGGAMDKLFGDNQAFSATLEFQTTEPGSDNTITMPGKISFDSGKSRFEMSMADMKGSQMPPDAAEQMKSMGMGHSVQIGRPDKNVNYMIFPGMQSYVEIPLPDTASSTNRDFKVETTELGQETVDGHECVKNKVVVTDKDGIRHESTVWNATDLKKFPVKIETGEKGRQSVMLFKSVSMEKPDASTFEVPSDYTKYASMQAMIQQIMMKQMGGMGMPGH